MHEASLHDVNCVVTLTYDEAHVPPDGSLVKRAFPDFIRRLRKRGHKARYFHCGEYGDLGRPHYHGALFGFDFRDKVPCEPSKSGAAQWVSPFLEELWPAGICKVGALNFESAAYIARYVTKKVTGRAAEGHYARVDDSTGEMFQIEPEFATMSRRPGLAHGWFDRFESDVYPADEVIVRGRSCKPPRYYDKKLSEDELAALKSARFVGSVGRISEGGASRLHVREVCTKSRLSLHRGSVP